VIISKEIKNGVPVSGICISQKLGLNTVSQRWSPNNWDANPCFDDVGIPETGTLSKFTMGLMCEAGFCINNKFKGETIIPPRTSEARQPLSPPLLFAVSQQ
jgi:hypothetical protein